jgi:HEPN domain-containing protein
MYGIETLGKTPSQLFNKKDGEEALQKAKYVHKIVSKFIEEFYSKK